MTRSGTPRLRIVVGSDRAGQQYKDALAADLQSCSSVGDVIDIGVTGHLKVPYPRIAFTASELIMTGKADRGLLVCHTGLGMAIAANKVRGIRAATAHDSLSVRHSILFNNAQILTIGQGVIGLQLARQLVTEWLTYRFDGASSAASKINEITLFEFGQRNISLNHGA